MICKVAKLDRDRIVTSCPLGLEMAQRCASLALAEHDQSGENLQVGGPSQRFWLMLLGLSMYFSYLIPFFFGGFTFNRHGDLQGLRSNPLKGCESQRRALSLLRAYHPSISTVL